MATVLQAPRPTADEAARRLGVQPSRIRLTPYPATEDDVLRIKAREGRLFELDDGVLVEKDMSYESGYVALTLGGLLRDHVRPGRLGAVNGPDGMMKLVAGMVRMPDVSFIPWSRFPGGRVPTTPVPLVAPDLAVEVLSPNNTRAEIDRKLGEYFAHGTVLAWVVDPAARTVEVLTTPDRAAAARLGVGDTLTGGVVLPGFAVPVADLFTDLEPS